MEKECRAEPLPESAVTTHIARSIEHHFSKPGIVGLSYTVSKEEEEEAVRKGLPVIPITPAPAPPHKIRQDYLVTVKERDEAIRRRQEAEERKRKEELDKKRQLEEQQAEERRLLEEMSQASLAGKKGKKGARGKKGGKAAKDAAKEGKSFPRRPSSVGSNSSAASSKTGKGGKGTAKGTTKGATKGKKAKDDMSVKSEKITRSKSSKSETPGPKRRVKSARRAGKSVSFIDEKSDSEVAEVPAIDLVPKEEPPPPAECPFRRDTQVIGEDITDKQKVGYFVALDDPGLGLGSGPIQRRPVSGWTSAGGDEKLYLSVLEN